MKSLYEPLTDLQKYVYSAENHYDNIHEKLLYVNTKMGYSGLNSICNTIMLHNYDMQIDRECYYKTLQSITEIQRHYIEPLRIDPYGEFVNLSDYAVETQASIKENPL